MTASAAGWRATDLVSRMQGCGIALDWPVGDGYLSYVISSGMYRLALATIEQAAEQAVRGTVLFGTGHLLFTRLDHTYEQALERATET